MSNALPKKNVDHSFNQISNFELFQQLFQALNGQDLNALYTIKENNSLHQLVGLCRTESCYLELNLALQLVQEFNRRYLSEGLQRTTFFNDPNDVKRFLLAELSQRRRERFIALFLDNQHRLIQRRVLFKGTINAAQVYPREVVRAAIDLNAAAVIFAHNHPSGIAEPSDADRRITDRLINALSLIDIRVLDHFVVGDSEVISFAERGWV
ncbi:RadC family protein [Umboniibacter marinipuniceus]|uniref:DNA repair protein RadC n=1 Tax=Umboniibacter marinipuniceus TaxID=569599 RepID=A0A3M0AAA0_9GAMM|nr:DNA repair protein RadC [Umboniibacter marinipuniceus]RMA82081.1 DNA repair protein RadC [Umboniibacter marinipuniceus]